MSRESFISIHAVLVRHLFRLWLANVPELFDATFTESKKMDDRAASILRVLANSRVNRDEVAVLQGTLNFKNLIRIFERVLLHRSLQRFRVAAEKGIVRRAACQDQAGRSCTPSCASVVRL